MSCERAEDSGEAPIFIGGSVDEGDRPCSRCRRARRPAGQSSQRSRVLIDRPRAWQASSQGSFALDAVIKLATAMTLLALLAAIVSACGGSGVDRTRRPAGADRNARRLPVTRDLDRLAGMPIPGTRGRCRFERETL